MNVHRVHRVILGLIIIMVFIGGCGYSYEKETEAMSTEMIIGVDEEGADSVDLYEDEPAYKYEIPTIDLEDIATENILCENILVDVKNGFENEQICNLYKDIIAEYEGASEGDEYYIMLLDSGDPRYPWLGFSTRDGLKIYALDMNGYQQSDGSTGHAVMATILQREEENDGICCRVTEVFSEVGVTEWQHQAWIRVCESPQGRGVSQIMTGACNSMMDLNRDRSLDIWDVNEDGFADIVYDEGIVHGSGGSFNQYRVFVWDEQSESYKDYDFPYANRIDRENHKLYVAYQGGVTNQYYVIYALRNGQYESYKQLHLKYECDVVCDDEGNIISLDKAVYSEWGEAVEETDITDLDWDETKELLEQKYPEFTFWKEG